MVRDEQNRVLQENGQFNFSCPARPNGEKSGGSYWSGLHQTQVSVNTSYQSFNTETFCRTSLHISKGLSRSSYSHVLFCICNISSWTGENEAKATYTINSTDFKNKAS